jgi:hypothetical protein
MVPNHPNHEYLAMERRHIASGGSHNGSSQQHPFNLSNGSYSSANEAHKYMGTSGIGSAQIAVGSTSTSTGTSSASSASTKPRKLTSVNSGTISSPPPPPIASSNMGGNGHNSNGSNQNPLSFLVSSAAPGGNHSSGTGTQGTAVKKGE